MSKEVKQSLTILVIDDNPLELGLIRLIIQKNFPDFKCLSLTKPPEWNTFLIGQIVDAIIVDYRLPEKNGLEVIKEIRKYDASIPAFLITALERDEIEQDIIKSGATDLIVKDRNYSNLVSKLNDLIMRKSFQKFEEEINILKKIINNFSTILILKIDENENCVEVLGNRAQYDWSKDDNLIGKNWKIFFDTIFQNLLNEQTNSEDYFSSDKMFELSIDQNIIKLKAYLIKSHFFYLILNFQI